MAKNPFIKFRKIFKPLREMGLRYWYWEKQGSFLILYFENKDNPYLPKKVSLSFWLREFDDCMDDDCILKIVKEEVDGAIEKIKEAISDTIYWSYMDKVGVDRLEL